METSWPCKPYPEQHRIEHIRLPGVFSSVAGAEWRHSVEIDCRPRQNPAYRSGRFPMVQEIGIPRSPSFLYKAPGCFRIQGPDFSCLFPIIQEIGIPRSPYFYTKPPDAFAFRGLIFHVKSFIADQDEYVDYQRKDEEHDNKDSCDGRELLIIGVPSSSE